MKLITRLAWFSGLAFAGLAFAASPNLKLAYVDLQQALQSVDAGKKAKSVSAPKKKPVKKK